MIVLHTKIIIGRIAFWLGWPLWFLVLRGSERSRVLLIANDRILLTRGTLSGGKWSLPGGGIHHGENATLGACREIYEELGIVLSADQLRELASEPTRNSGIAYQAHILIADLDDCVQPMLSLEVAEARWVPLTEVRNMHHDDVTIRALELLAAC